MGLENIRVVSGSALSGVFGGLPIRDFVAELLAPDRERINYAAPVELGTYSLATEVGERFREREFTLPRESYERVERLLGHVGFQKLKRAIKMGGAYAHEYLENPSFLSSLAEYVEGFTKQEERRWPNDHYAFKRDQVHEMLGRTFAHLTAGRLYLFNRRKQFEQRPDLKELFDKIDKEQLPEVYKKKGISLEYWL